MVSLALHTILNNVCSDVAFDVGICFFRSAIHDRYLRPDMHKNQLQRNSSTISCILSTNPHYIYKFLIIIFKIFQVFLRFTILTFQTGLKDFLSFIPFCSLTTEEHTPSWILVPDDGLLAYIMAAIRISSLTEQPKTWPEGHRKR